MKSSDVSPKESSDKLNEILNESVGESQLPKVGEAPPMPKCKPPKKENPIMQYFEYGHLPERLQKVSAPICDVAQYYDEHVKDGPEKSAGLRKLLEAKDCLVRAAL